MNGAIDQSETACRTTLSGPATAESARDMRDGLTAWLRARGAPGPLVLDTVLGVNEALANCVDHAYAGHRRPGGMAILVDFDTVAESVSVCVTDSGAWRPPEPCALHDTRGRGVALMHALAAHCTISGRPDGTTVCLDYRATPV